VLSATIPQLFLYPDCLQICGGQDFVSALEFKISWRPNPQIKSTLTVRSSIKIYTPQKNLFSDRPSYVKEPFVEWATEVMGK